MTRITLRADPGWFGQSVRAGGQPG